MYIVVVSSIMTYAVYEIEQTRIEGVTIPSDFFTENLVFTDSDEFSELFDGKVSASAYYKIENNSLNFENWLPYRYEDIYLIGVEPCSNGNYELVYNITNPDNSHFRFWIYRAGFLDIGSIYAEFTDDKLSLKRVRQLYDSTITEVSLSNPASGKIKTSYNPATGHTEISLNGVTYLTSTIDTPKSINNYGGIGVKGYTFTVLGIETPIRIQQEEAPSIFEIIGQLLLWNVSEDYIPNWLNIILIKVPIIFLALAIAFYIRGVD